MTLAHRGMTAAGYGLRNTGAQKGVTPQLAQEILSAASGTLVGCSLGLIGGVAVNAALSLAEHARAGSVKWRCGGMYAAAGVTGAWFGSSLGKIVDGQRLLFLFALVMIVIGGLM